MTSIQLKLIVIFLSFLFCETFSNPLIIERAEELYRLPSNTIPETYDIWLTTNIHDGKFDFVGKVQIGIKIIEDTSVIVLNNLRLEIKKVTIIYNGTETELKFENVVSHELLKISTDKIIVKGTGAYLKIEYSGVMSMSNFGFFYTSYLDEDGKEKFIAATHFEPTLARAAIPCYDEPARKAKFILHLTHDQSYSAISNMPLKGQPTVPDADNKVTSTFEETPLMSTYLLSWAVTNFDWRIVTNPDVNHRVFARKSKISDSFQSLSFGYFVLRNLEKYLQVNYSLPKVDSIAIPGLTGAVENWGLITYGESDYLFDELSVTKRQRQLIYTTVAHEMAHQFFGNYVTPAWWSHLWLKEGFAKLFESYNLETVTYERRLMDIFVVETLQTTMIADSLESTRPMTAYGESPAEISSLFDGIAYGKSACVLRMILHAVSDTTFSKGLNFFLTANKFGTAIDTDLFIALQAAVDVDNIELDGNTIAEIMESWTNQKGYPLVTVTRDNSKSIMTIKQKRFQMSPSNNAPKARWYIPINLVTANWTGSLNTRPSLWLKDETFQVETELKDNVWILFNTDQTGYYRVNYDKENWNLLRQQLLDDYSRIRPINRAQIIDDSFALARSGYIDYEIPLEFLEYLKKETDFIPWVSASNALQFIHRLLPLNEYLNRYILELADTLYPKYKSMINSETDGDGDDILMLTIDIINLAINWACKFGSTECLAMASTTLNDFLASPLTNNILPDFRETIYCNGIRDGRIDSHFYSLWDKLQQSNDQVERNMIIDALGCTTNASLQLQYLQYTIDSSYKYEAGEQMRVFKSVYQNSLTGVETALDFINDNHEAFLKTTSISSLTSAFIDMATFTTTPDLVTKLTDLLIKLHSETIIDVSIIEKTLLVIQENKSWQENYGSIVVKWLGDYYFTDNSASAGVISLTCILFCFLLLIFNQQ